MQRLPPRAELINALEFEEVAQRKLSPEVFATIAGGNRAAFDRITLRPRMLIPTLDLDLTVDLFGDAHFTPILVGPVADQRRYHPDAELATVRGASAAKAAVVISSRSSVGIGEIAAQAKTPLWFAVYADAGSGAQKEIQQAIAAGCKVLCITSPGARIDWKAIAQIRRGVEIPIVIKGVMTTEDAKIATELGARGIVVSDHGSVARNFLTAAASAKAVSSATNSTTAPIDVLPGIVDLVGGRATVLVDGSFRRGSDILKALIFGAQGVLVARPVMWGLAAYGADGVQSVVELLQSDLGRHMGALGASNLKSLNRNFVRIHRR